MERLVCGEGVCGEGVCGEVVCGEGVCGEVGVCGVLMCVGGDEYGKVDVCRVG